MVARPGLLGLAESVVDAVAERDLGETVVVGHSMGAYLAPWWRRLWPSGEPR